MADFEMANLIYLLLLLAVLSFWVFSGRDGAAKKVKYLGIWAVIFLGTIAAVGLWTDIRDRNAPAQAVFSESGRIEIPRAFDGHYHVTIHVNSEPVRFVVDTGASGVVLTREDAARVGLESDDLAYLGSAMTANGTVRTAPVVLERVTLGPFQDRNVRAAVNEGEMSSSLLGMSYLQRFERLEISNNRLILER